MILQEKRLNLAKSKTVITETILNLISNGSDLVVLLTEWDEFKSIDFKKIVKNSKFKVYDLRNLYSAEEMKKK